MAMEPASTVTHLDEFLGRILDEDDGDIFICAAPPPVFSSMTN